MSKSNFCRRVPAGFYSIGSLQRRGHEINLIPVDETPSKPGYSTTRAQRSSRRRELLRQPSDPTLIWYRTSHASCLAHTLRMIPYSGGTLYGRRRRCEASHRCLFPTVAVSEIWGKRDARTLPCDRLHTQLVAKGHARCKSLPVETRLPLHRYSIQPTKGCGPSKTHARAPMCRSVTHTLTQCASAVGKAAHIPSARLASMYCTCGCCTVLYCCTAVLYPPVTASVICRAEERCGAREI